MVLFMKDYKPNQDFKLSFDSFKLTFKCMLHLFASGISKMIFEHLQGCFHPNLFANGFPQLFQLFLILHKVIIYVKLHRSLGWPTS